MNNHMWIILYTIVVGFVMSSVQHVVTQNEPKPSSTWPTTPITTITDLHVEAISVHGHSIQLLVKWNGTYADGESRLCLEFFRIALHISEKSTQP